MITVQDIQDAIHDNRIHGSDKTGKIQVVHRGELKSPARIILRAKPIPKVFLITAAGHFNLVDFRNDLREALHAKKMIAGKGYPWDQIQVFVENEPVRSILGAERNWIVLCT